MGSRMPWCVLKALQNTVSKILERVLYHASSTVPSGNAHSKTKFVDLLPFPIHSMK